MQTVLQSLDPLAAGHSTGFTCPCAAGQEWGAPLQLPFISSHVRVPAWPEFHLYLYCRTEDQRLREGTLELKRAARSKAVSLQQPELAPGLRRQIRKPNDVLYSIWAAQVQGLSQVRPALVSWSSQCLCLFQLS